MSSLGHQSIILMNYQKTKDERVNSQGKTSATAMTSSLGGPRDSCDMYGHRHDTRDETPHASSLVGGEGEGTGGREGGPDPSVHGYSMMIYSNPRSFQAHMSGLFCRSRVFFQCRSKYTTSTTKLKALRLRTLASAFRSTAEWDEVSFWWS